ncbi:hypothetical protein [Carnimonas bestiolae]|uniref:hypothetical protein n=1 Tax=Carnimonas bestiolae TaxID=3402172 RepID=UPI003EDC6407
MQPHAVASRQARKYAPRGLCKQAIGLRLKPEEQQKVDALAESELITVSGMARKLMLLGLEQYNNQSQRTH